MNDSKNIRLIGNIKNIEYFDRLIENDKLNHAYMIVGPSKSGKMLFVKEIIDRMVVKYDSDEFLTRIHNNLCPDVITIDILNDKKLIGIDQVREGLVDINLTPFELSFKVYIIKNAHLLTVQAQNALLKSIEEPNDDVYFFLLTTNSSLLLPTINSRVQKIYVEVFSYEKMYDILKRKFMIDKDDEIIKFASRFSNGSIGYALQLLNEDGYEFKTYQTVKNIVSGLSKRGTNYTYFDFIQELDSTYKTTKKDRNEQRKNFGILISFLTFALRDILTYKMSSNPNYIFFGEEDLLEYSQSFGTINIQNCLSYLSKLELELKYNYSVPTACKTLAVNLWHNMN